MDNDEDFTAAPVRPLPPLRPRTIMATAVAGFLIFGVIIVGAIAVRMANDRLEHPDCETWLSHRDALRRQLAADEQTGDCSAGPQETMPWGPAVHQFQLQEWEKKRPAGCA
jgi:hypothetical protein